MTIMACLFPVRIVFVEDDLILRDLFRDSFGDSNVLHLQIINAEFPIQGVVSKVCYNFDFVNLFPCFATVLLHLDLKWQMKAAWEINMPKKRIFRPFAKSLHIYGSSWRRSIHWLDVERLQGEIGTQALLMHSSRVRDLEICAVGIFKWS